MALRCIKAELIPVSELSDHQADLQGLRRFRDWLESLVNAQQPIDEWSMSLDALRERWLPGSELPPRDVSVGGRLFF